jgi:succinyl-CoA synthetase alpha subunit
MFEADFETEAVGVIGEIGGMLKRGWQPATQQKFIEACGSICCW